MKSISLGFCAYPAALGLAIALAGCTSETRDCAPSSIMLRVKCASGVEATAATASLTRLEDDKFNELPLSIDCSRVSNIQVNIPDYAAGQHFDIVVQGIDGAGAPIGAPTRVTKLPLVPRCTVLDLTIEGLDAAMPDPNPMQEMDAGGRDGQRDVDAADPADAGPPGSKDPGEACVATSECKEGVCASGVCCESTCEGTCESCNQVGSPGRCRPVPLGKVPSAGKACADEGAASCGLNGTCDGQGACAKYADGTLCEKGMCDGGGTKGRNVCQSGACSAQDEKICAPFRCDAQTVDCFPKCANDDQCVAGRNCMNESCGKKPLGSSCEGDAECLSDKCADKVCCNTACSGACEACNLPGTLGQCMAVARGAADPHNECKNDGQNSCQKTGLCDGARGCALYEAKTICKAASCSGNNFIAAGQCDGQGRCIDGSSSACSPSACTSNSCVSRCETNADCVGGNLCINNSCGKKDNGATCGGDGECKTNFCRDGVCCENACTGACRTCNPGGNAGKCTMVAVGVSDPRNECTRENASTCSTDGTCDGAGGCRRYPSGTQCVAPTCNSSTNTGAFRHECNGSGLCQQTRAPESCAPGRCSGNACTLQCSKNEDCVAPNTCVNGFCGKKPNGQICSQATECASGHCAIEGVCCENACTGGCRSCNLAGKAGTCEFVPSNAVDTRNVCKDQGAAMCGNTGRCDGSGGCLKYASGIECRAQSCAAATYTAASKCDGNGTCANPAPGPCPNNLTCLSSSQCKNSCSTDADCALASLYCLNGACVAKRANGMVCGAAGSCASGSCVNDVCCTTTSCGSCQRCDLNGAGTCSAVAEGQPDPLNMCLDQGGASCGNNGVCGAGGSCQKHACICDGFAMPNPASAGLPNPASYTVGDGFVTDNVTKLVWEEPISTAAFTQPDAIKYCSDKGGGWRLPTVVELYSLVDFTRYSPSIDVAMFPNTPSSFFWTSSALARNSSAAWVVLFVGPLFSSLGRNETSRVRCVR